MTRPPEYEGTRFTILCQELDNGTCPVGEFLDGLSKSDRKKLDALFERLGDHGQIFNREKFQKVEDDLWEFKSFQNRILCFFTPNREVVLCASEIKKRDELRPATVRTAHQRRKEFYTSGR